MRRLALAAALLSLSCSSLFEPEGDGVRTKVVKDQISVANNTWETVYVAAFATDDLPAILWGPCTDPETCDGIESGEQRLIGFPRRIGSQDVVNDATLYWWHLVPKSGGGFKPDSIRYERVHRSPF